MPTYLSRNSRTNANQSAFTLIELLIVVAIIAILAAIAVPNFLEAQVRAKVSRVKSDMRSLAVAAEAYHVDWNVILGANDLEDLLNVTQQQGRLIAYSLLTSPVAFITSIPKDPFQIGHSLLGGGRQEDEFQFQASNKFNTGNWGIPRMRGYNWVFASHGPALRRTGPVIRNVLRGNTAVERTFFYDATNGVKSEGFLFRTNKGEAFVDNSPGV